MSTRPQTGMKYSFSIQDKGLYEEPSEWAMGSYFHREKESDKYYYTEYVLRKQLELYYLIYYLI